ncbi:MAG: gp436 family protein [Planctomycetota bacterium]
MSYCSESDVEDRIGPDQMIALADHDGDGSADSAVVQQAIRSASAVVDGYLGVRFAVPVQAPGGGTPEALRARAVNLAVYFLKLGRDSVTEEARAQYESDVEWLREVVAGRASLGVDPEPAEHSGAPAARWDGEPRLFGRDEPL